MNWDNFTNVVSVGVKQLAGETFENAIQAANDDVTSFLVGNKSKIEKWCDAVKNKEMTKEDLEDLIKGEKDLMEMAALTKLGIVLTELERFRVQAIELIVNAILKAI